MLGLVTKGILAVGVGAGGGPGEIIEIELVNRVILDQLQARVTMDDSIMAKVFLDDLTVNAQIDALSAKAMIDDLGAAASSKVLSSSAVIDKPSTKESMDDPIVISHWWYEE